MRNKANFNHETNQHQTVQNMAPTAITLLVQWLSAKLRPFLCLSRTRGMRRWGVLINCRCTGMKGGNPTPANRGMVKSSIQKHIHRIDREQRRRETERKVSQTRTSWRMMTSSTYTGCNKWLFEFLSYQLKAVWPFNFDFWPWQGILNPIDDGVRKSQ